MRRTRAAIAFGALTLAVLSPLACRDVAGVERREPRRCLGVSFADGACGTCASDACCDAIEVCLDDEACRIALDCDAACAAADRACHDRCDRASMYTDARAALDACRASSCRDACGYGCRAPAVPPLGCDRCSDACCSFASACAATEDCGLRRACLEACTDAPCREACDEAHPVGASAVEAIRTCVDAACGGDADWSCTGRVVWPTVDATAFSLVVRVVDVTTGVPFDGLSVSVCSDADPSCDPPQSGPVLADEGGAHVTVVPPTVTHGGWEGFLQVDAPALYPALLFAEPPISAPTSVSFVAPSRATFEGVAPRPLDPERGHVVVAAVDCATAAASGVSLSLDGGDEQTVTVYATTRSLADDTASETSAALGGIGGFLNVPPGRVRLHARRSNACEEVGSVSVWVKSGRLTIVRIPPSPLRALRRGARAIIATSCTRRRASTSSSHRPRGVTSRVPSPSRSSSIPPSSVF